MKKLLSILVIFIVLAGVIMGFDWYASGKIEEIVKADLDEFVEDEGVEMTYEVIVKPLQRKLILENVTLNEEFAKAKVDKVEVLLAWSDFLALTAGRELHEIHGFNILTNNILFEEYEGFMRLYISELSLDFKGKISEEMFEEEVSDLPTEQMNMDICLNNVKFEIPELYQMNLPVKDLEKLFSIDEATLRVEYNPKDQTVNIPNAKIINSIGTANASYQIKMNNDFDEITVESMKVSQNADCTGMGMILGKIFNMDNFSIDRWVYDSDIELEYAPDTIEGYVIKNGKVNMTLEGLSTEIPDELKYSLFWLTEESLQINKWQLDLSIVEKDININSDLYSSLLNAQLNAEIRNDVMDPYIRMAKLKVSEMSESVEEAVTMVEYIIGKPLPREGKDIVLEIWGWLSAPQIRGINFNY